MTIETRTLGRSGPTVSRLGLGFDAVAGSRCDAAQMAHLDSER